MMKSNSPYLLRPVRKDEFIPPVNRWTRLGGFALAGTVGVLVTVASMVKYNVVVKANAVIRPTGELRIVQAPVEGSITRIEVQANQTIQKGQVLAVLDDAKLQSQRSQLMATIEQAKAQIYQIDAQRTALDRQIAAEASLMERAIASAEENLSSSQRNLRDRRITTEADLEEAEMALQLAQEEFDKYQQAVDAGVMAPVLLLQKQQAVTTAEARVKRVQASLNPTDAEVGVAEQRIAQERARGESTLAALRKEQGTLAQRRVDSQNQMAQAQEQIRQLESEMAKNKVRAPIDGTILELNLRNPGQTVQAGESIAHMSPSNTPLVLKGQIAPGDIGKIQVGQTVQMRVSAFPYPDYGVLTGTVAEVAPDRTVAQVGSTGTTGAPSYYEVTIEPDVAYLKNNPKNAIQPGMEGTIDIVVQEETVLTFILRKARFLSNL